MHPHNHQSTFQTFDPHSRSLFLIEKWERRYPSRQHCQQRHPIRIRIGIGYPIPRASSGASQSHSIGSNGGSRFDHFQRLFLAFHTSTPAPEHAPLPVRPLTRDSFEASLSHSFRQRTRGVLSPDLIIVAWSSEHAIRRRHWELGERKYL